MRRADVARIRPWEGVWWQITAPALLNARLLLSFYQFCDHKNIRLFPPVVLWFMSGFILAVTFNMSKNGTYHSEGCKEKDHKGVSFPSSAPIENVCFSHQFSLFPVLFNLFTFSPHWRGTVHWFIVPASCERCEECTSTTPATHLTVFRPCSYVELPVCWLLSVKDRRGKGPTRASQGPHKIKKSLAIWRPERECPPPPPLHNLALSEYQTAWDPTCRGCFSIC